MITYKKNNRIGALLLCFAVATTVISCGDKGHTAAEESLARIEALYEAGEYRAVLDSIVLLRDAYPEAVDVRRRALTLWQDASLALAQDDIGRTDIALQETLAAIDAAPNVRSANLLRVRRDSLQARYDALCGVVRMIRAKQQDTN